MSKKEQMMFIEAGRVIGILGHTLEMVINDINDEVCRAGTLLQLNSAMSTYEQYVHTITELAKG